MRILLLALLAASLCAGQAADEGKSAMTNVMGAEYPKVHADLSVTFSLKAPESQKVQVDISAKKYDMQKGADGVWDVTIPPQAVGFHYYQFWVDGVSVPDPGSDTLLARRRSDGDASGRQADEHQWRRHRNIQTGAAQRTDPRG